MLTYDFQKAEGPMYAYVYQCIKEDIIKGNLQPGEKLPSKRTFAHNNGISTITIQNAYDQLISEGYVYTLPKRGYYVAKIEGIRRLPKEAGISLDIHVPEEKENYWADLSNNHMNPDNFPFSVWAKLSRETISKKSSELMEVSPTGGTFELRQAIAEHLKSFRGMLVDPNQIVIGAGTEYLYGVLIQLLGYDKNYCIENPGYQKLAKIYQQHQITCSYGDMDEEGIMPKALEKSKVQIAHICPTHHFPTGITMPASRRYEILAWANEKEGRYIIEDDYDSEFRLSGKPIPTLFGIDACEKVIYMNTFSKSLSPTIRISYMILPAHLANEFYRRLSFYACTVSNFEQYTLAEFIHQGYFEKHINRMRLYYTRQRRQLMDIIKKSPLGEKCEILPNHSGLHFLIKLDTGCSDRKVIERLKKKGIRISSVGEYYVSPNENSRHLFIVNYSNIDMDQMEKVCEEIFQSISEK